MKIRKLSPLAFERALKVGLGSAYLHVSQYGDEGVSEDIVEAMMKSHVYDWQIEGDRAGWIFQIIRATGRVGYYAKRFQAAFSKDIDDGCDLAQQLLLCGHFFDAGYPAFREIAFAIYPMLLENHSVRVTCGTVLTELAGENGFAFASKTISDHIEDVSDWSCSCVFEHADRWLNNKPINDAWDKAIAKYPDSKPFLEAAKRFWEIENFKIKPTPPTPQPDLQTIFEMIDRKEGAPNAIKYRRLGWALSAADREKVIALLHAPADDWHYLCYLQLLEKYAQPALTETLLSMVSSSPRNVAFYAAQALSKVGGAAVRLKGLELIKSGIEDKIDLGFEMLEQSYQIGDARLLLDAAKKIIDRDCLHRSGSSVLDMAKLTRDPMLEKLVLWFYENGPESFCRGRFLSIMMEWNICTPRLLYEAQWDSSDDIQMTARSKLAMI